MIEDTGLLPCVAAEKLLRAEALDALGDLEQSRLRQHLRGCASCRAYRRLLQRFRAALAPTADSRPDPAVRDCLRQAVRNHRRRGSLVRLFRRPVPAYQVLLGAAAAIFLVFVFELLKSDAPLPAASLAEPRTAAYARVDSYEVLARLKLLDTQHRGRDQAEDSLLIRLSVTSLQLADSI